MFRNDFYSIASAVEITYNLSKTNSLAEFNDWYLKNDFSWNLARKTIIHLAGKTIIHFPAITRGEKKNWNLHKLLKIDFLTVFHCWYLKNNFSHNLLGKRLIFLKCLFKTFLSYLKLLIFVPFYFAIHIFFNTFLCVLSSFNAICLMTYVNLTPFLGWNIFGIITNIWWENKYVKSFQKWNLKINF